MTDATHWLIVESLENWEVDESNDFSHFGISNRLASRAKTMQPGDLLITYVTGASCFADIRKVTKAGFRKLAMGGDYQDSFPFCIDTAPKLVLAKASWLSAHDVRERLSITAGRKHWGMVFRSCPRRILSEDAAILISELESRA